jgi:mono/diheme cytochrome c family protein
MRSGFRGAIVALCAIAALAAVPAFAENEQLALGKKQYMKYCATCHGPSGTGTDGVASKLFKKPPANLTLLAQKNGGKFPMLEVLNIVKGDEPIKAHGTREMPVWGQILGRPLTEGMYGKDQSSAEILNIGQYLESIQVK